MLSPDILDIIPEHAVDPVRRAPWGRRVLTGCGDGLLSLLLNGAVVGGMIAAGWPLRQLASPTAISVELVNHMPDQKGPASDTTKQASVDIGASKGSEHPAEPAPAPRASAKAPVREEPPAESAPVSSQPEGSAKPEEPPAEAAASDGGKPAEATAAPVSPTLATPPPPEHPDNTAAPHLVEAPVASRAGAEMQHEPARPDTPPPAGDAGPLTSDTPAAAPVIATPADTEAVPSPSPPPETPKPPTAEQRRQAENTATLAAMLPFGADIRGTPFGTPQGQEDQAASTAYRGQVYANFNKAQDVITEARTRHLKGQAVIAFTIDDQGGIATIGVAVSSRDPAVDQAALDLIRKAAPFPPPPPGAQRSFSPAIGLGLDE